MHAIYFEEHGGAEVLKYGEIKDPVAGPGEILVGVKACALNHLDIWVRQGLPGIPIPMPHIPGSDVSGVVLETGKGVKRLKKGGNVVVCPGQLSGLARESFEARDSYSPDFQILGLQTQGGYAEKICVPERFVVSVSEKYSPEEWASFGLAGLTAYHMLVTRAKLKAGETVLVHGAGSGIGGFALQIARFLGATVFATVGDFKKVSRAKKLGAEEVILYRTEDFAEKINKLTGQKGADVIFDHIGPDTWSKNFNCLTRGGRMVFCGATSGPRAEVDIRVLYMKQLSLLGAYMGSFAEFLKVLELAEKGVLAPVIDQVFSLREAADAQRRMESRQNFGKIVLKI
jgi:NADPH:quinone reductase-like Zn-dependent oxidoreductase